MKTVEEAERISITQLRTLPGWEQVVGNGRGSLVTPDGVVHEVCLTTDTTPTNGRRPWLVCPTCGSRRRDLFAADGKLQCRKCTRLLYFAQRLPDSSWRRELAAPILRGLGGLSRQHSSA